MKKIIVAIVFFIGVCLMSDVIAADSYLYWFVGEDAKIDNEDLSTAGATYARIGMADSYGNNVGYLNLYDSSGTVDSGQYSVVPMGGAAYAGLSDAYSYYIELVNDSGAFVGRSEFYGSAQLADYIGQFGTGTPSTGAWNVTSFTSAPVPEPNSAMLVLLGMACLGLRRRQRKI